MKISSDRKYRILFVCHGNICRSPMAEFIFKDKITKQGLTDLFHIESAAVSTEETGNPIYPPAKQTLNAHGIPYDRSKTARRISASDYNRFDLIICMDSMNLRWIHSIIPNDPEDKICLMMSFTGQISDVADPWYTGDFEKTYMELDRASDALLIKILPKKF